MLDAMPVLMVKNEERWLEPVLEPLLHVFGRAIVGDTGSTDGTVAIAHSFEQCEVIEYGPQTPHGLMTVRQDLGMLAQQRGAKFIFLCDGDELYNTRALLHIAQEGMAEGMKAGFTTMLSVDEDDAGNLYEMDDKFSRLAVTPAGGTWHSAYPFEIPAEFDEVLAGAPIKSYFTLPSVFGYHAVHLHRLKRSRCDGEVFMRLEKQKQFSLHDNPNIYRTAPFDLNKWRSKS
jgi:glycosyltransferase involved in cell wall biosynthesis